MHMICFRVAARLVELVRGYFHDRGQVAVVGAVN